MKRRQFILALGSAATCTVSMPCAAQAQQPAMKVIGFLSSGSADAFENRVRAFRQGLKEGGMVEGDNVAIAYRWAEGQNDRLPALADDLVRRQVAVIAAFGSIAAASAKAASATIPIVFAVDDDPVKRGLVASLSRPGGNLTGVNFVANELAAKRLALLRELVPIARRIAVLANPTYPAAETMTKDVGVAAPAMGVEIEAVNATTSAEINAVFAGFARSKPDALFVGGDPFFTVRRAQLVNLASRHALPASFSTREYCEIGGLMSYGTNIADAWRHAGAYVGRVLKGAKPADLPVEQSSKFELAINAETARMLGITIPPTLLAIADEMIE